METEKETCMRPKWMTKLLGCSSSQGGNISTQQLPSLLSELNPRLNVDKNQLSNLIKQNDPEGSGVLDFDTVTKILFQLMLKQPCSDDDDDENASSSSSKFNSTTIVYDEDHHENSDCSCSVPGACTAIKITDFIIFPSC